MLITSADSIVMTAKKPFAYSNMSTDLNIRNVYDEMNNIMMDNETSTIWILNDRA